MIKLRTLQCLYLTSLNYQIYNKVKSTSLYYSNHRILRLFSVNQENSVVENDQETQIKTGLSDNKKDVKFQRAPQIIETVANYVKSRPSLLVLEDLVVLALSEKQGGIYLLDECVAKQISELITPELQNESDVVVEVNPGLGLVTEQLQHAGVSNIRVFESTFNFFNYLKGKFAAKEVKVYHKNVTSFHRLQLFDSTVISKKMPTMFEGRSTRKSVNEPLVNLIGIFTSTSFMYNVINNIVLHTDLAKYNNLQLFLILDPITYYVLTASGSDGYHSYRPISVLFQLLFDHNLLLKLPRSVFLPPSKKKQKMYSQIERKVMREYPDTMFMVKLTMVEDFPKDTLITFRYFLRQLFSSSNLRYRVIPILEQWVPGCGPRLIGKGMNVYTEIGELDPDQIFNLFSDFISWDDNRSDSLFYSGIESYSLRKKYGEMYVSPDD